MTADPKALADEPEKPDAPEPGAPTPEEDVKMTIWEHLDELRRRLIRAVLAVAVTTCVAWAFKDRILKWLIHPYIVSWHSSHLPGAPELQGLAPSDVFMAYLELSVVTGIIASAPIIFYQLWAFVSPGLYQREKKFVIPFVVFSTSLFLSGVAFAYYVAFPFTFDYFFSFSGKIADTDAIITQRWTLEHYLDFATMTHLAMGLVFELPLFISFLAIAGIVTPMQLVRFGRWAILLSFIIGAVVTPGPAVAFQFVVSGALIGLYLISVGLAFLLARKKKVDAPAEKK